MRRPANNSATNSRGFTMLDLMVVLAILAILTSIAIPTYNHSVLRAREKALRSDLDNLNALIVQYTLDKQKAPQGLDDLKAAGYLRKIPNDPMTGEPNWEVVQEEVLLSADQQDTGITGVHSASNAISSEGDAYSSW
jgi:general secretion pathway protein G